MAGLPASKACVSVGPPLLASGPSSGLALLRSPGPAKAQVASLLRLWLNCWGKATELPLQFPPAALLATIVLFRLALLALNIPPPLAAALSVTVLLLRVRAVPMLNIPLRCCR